jgi:hypothetical protein
MVMSQQPVGLAMKMLCSNEFFRAIAADSPDRLLKQRGEWRSLAARPVRFAEQCHDSWSAFAASPTNS